MRVLLDRGGTELPLTLELAARSLQSGDAGRCELVVGKPQPIQMVDVRTCRQQSGSCVADPAVRQVKDAEPAEYAGLDHGADALVADVAQADRQVGQALEVRRANQL